MDKNHNPRKGTETDNTAHSKIFVFSVDKNHNPRKGTETKLPRFLCAVVKVDKNHNPRKGTETTSNKGISTLRKY